MIFILVEHRKEWVGTGSHDYGDGDGASGGASGTTHRLPIRLIRSVCSLGWVGSTSSVGSVGSVGVLIHSFGRTAKPNVLRLVGSIRSARAFARQHLVRMRLARSFDFDNEPCGSIDDSSRRRFGHSHFP